MWLQFNFPYANNKNRQRVYHLKADHLRLCQRVCRGVNESQQNFSCIYRGNKYFNCVHWASQRKTRGRNEECLVSFALTVVSWPAYFRFVCRLFAVVSFSPPLLSDSPERFRAAHHCRIERGLRPLNSREPSKKKYLRKNRAVTSSTRARRSSSWLLENNGIIER